MEEVLAHPRLAQDRLTTLAPPLPRAPRQVRLSPSPNPNQVRANLTLTLTLTSCNATMAPCVGPAEAGYKTLLAQAASDGQVEYGEQFYSRLSHMLVLVCA